MTTNVRKKPRRKTASKRHDVLPGIAPTSRRDFTRLLRGVRVNRELSTRDVARATRTSVRRVAAIENGGDVLLSELQRYVWVLGYELTLEKASRPQEADP